MIYKRVGNGTRRVVFLTSALTLQNAGVDLLLLATNTMHVVDVMLEGIHIPFLHIADCTALEIAGEGLRKVALLGTRFTMQEDFYRQRIADQAGVEVLVPQQDQQVNIDRIIFEELCVGRIEARSKKYYLDVIASLVEQGAQGVILGCTEIGLLIQPLDTEIKQFDTAKIHVRAALDAALM
ncbi:MAG: amino acid racemase [Bdellovibrionota bacterium]